MQIALWSWVIQNNLELLSCIVPLCLNSNLRKMDMGCLSPICDVACRSLLCVRRRLRLVTAKKKKEQKQKRKTEKKELDWELKKRVKTTLQRIEEECSKKFH